MRTIIVGCGRVGAGLAGSPRGRRRRGHHHRPQDRCLRPAPEGFAGQRGARRRHRRGRPAAHRHRGRGPVLRAHRGRQPEHPRRAAGRRDVLGADGRGQGQRPGPGRGVCRDGHRHHLPDGHDGRVHGRLRGPAHGHRRAAASWRPTGHHRMRPARPRRSRPDVCHRRRRRQGRLLPHQGAPGGRP